MAETAIEWTHVTGPDGRRHKGFTFNPWWGCTEQSPACANCYAREFAKRVGRRGLWGAQGHRRFFGEKHWNQIDRWAKKARKLGVRLRVFCASMADWCERHDDPAVRAMQDAARAKLFAAIERTRDCLDWLLLTKLPESILDVVPQSWREGGAPPNAWFGSTMEDCKRVRERAPRLLDAVEKMRATVAFASCEPLLEDISSEMHKYAVGCFVECTIENKPDAPDGGDPCEGCDAVPNSGRTSGEPCGAVYRLRLSWVIVGCESGRKSRPSHPQWVRAMRDLCEIAGIPFHFKQWGQFKVVGEVSHVRQWREAGAATRVPGGGRFIDYSGRHLRTKAEIEAAQFPIAMVRRCASKHAAGRELDGDVHDGAPRPPVGPRIYTNQRGLPLLDLIGQRRS